MWMSYLHQTLTPHPYLLASSLARTGGTLSRIPASDINRRRTDRAVDLASVSLWGAGKGGGLRTDGAMDLASKSLMGEGK